MTERVDEIRRCDVIAPALVPCKPGGDPGPGRGARLGRRPLALRPFQPGAPAGVRRRLTVWEQGDIQSFRGESSLSAPVEARYAGNLRTAYLRVDVTLGRRWLAGVAVARSGGGAGWPAGTAAGRVKTTLTAGHPYPRWSDGETSLWALGVVGRGAAANQRAADGSRETGRLGLLAGTAGGAAAAGDRGRGRAAGPARRGSWARLTTGAGEQTLDGLRLDVHRTRMGAEAARDPGRAGGRQRRRATASGTWGRLMDQSHFNRRRN